MHDEYPSRAGHAPERRSSVPSDREGIVYSGPFFHAVPSSDPRRDIGYGEFYGP